MMRLHNQTTKTKKKPQATTTLLFGKKNVMHSLGYQKSSRLD